MIAYIEPFAGISGDMLLGALLSAGWPLDELNTTVDTLGLDDVRVEAKLVLKHGVAATQVHIVAPAAQPLRHPADLNRIIDAANLPPAVKAQAQAAINRLAQAEAHVHGTIVEEVHFHEIGAVDTLVDVVGAVAGFHALDVDKIVCAPLPWSTGTVQTEHGLLPVPPPAVVALLEGVPVVGIDVEGETVTPTGATLAVTLASRFDVMPQLTVHTVGQGSGTHEWPDRPNILRLTIGEPADQADGARREALTLLACNLDDMQPEWYRPVMTRLFEGNALDVWWTPIHMKKERPAMLIEVLCQPQDAAHLRKILFQHTTTLGIRETSITRWALPRRTRTVDTEYGSVRVKEAQIPNGAWRAVPEHDDCEQLATKAGVSVRDVWLATLKEASDA
jgi:uncharacterized protein (TIGR00299 family) protein